MTVGIVGLGLIGGSFAKAYFEAGETVLAYDADKSVLDFAKLSGTVSGELTEVILQRVGVFHTFKRHGKCTVDRAGIQTALHLHKTDTGFIVPVQQSLSDGRCSAITRQKGSVDIDTADLRRGKNTLFEDLSERNDAEHIRCKLPEMFQKLRGIDIGGTDNFQSQIQSGGGKRSRGQYPFASGGAVKL